MLPRERENTKGETRKAWSVVEREAASKKYEAGIDGQKRELRVQNHLISHTA